VRRQRGAGVFTFMLSVIIVAAGSSTRAGRDKIFAPLAGRPLIHYCLEAFQETPCVDEIVVVARPLAKDALSKFAIQKLRATVPGGERRQHSVAAGLRAISSAAEFIAVHDAARPLITPREIERVFVSAQKNGAAVLANPITDTLKLGNNDEIICGSLDRENVFAMQTPQIFARTLLIDAYRRVMKEGRSITDDVSAVQRLGAKVAIVRAADENMKITFANDFALAELILQRRRI
jgi:2-C-methyl-D-erythritol 4-phosphate cytidylyltransferase